MHSLRLTGPWFRWQRQRNQQNRAPRQTRPVFLKYDSPKLVNQFLANPQRNYTFDEDDRVFVTGLSPYTTGLLYRLQIPSITTDVIKLFRDTHKRSYLVVTELHCETPGLPDASWDHICELGFVVRRWVPKHARLLRARMRNIDQRMALLEAHLLRLDGRLGPLRKTKDPVHSPAALLQIIALGPLAVHHRKVIYQAQLDQLRALRKSLEVPDPASWHLQYWRPHSNEHDGIGAWQPATGPTSKQLFDGEKVYNLYRLIPDPTKKDHTAKGARLLFGLVPTGDMDTTDSGEPHFDADDTYEVRCFVRQHKPCAQLKLNQHDCHGTLYWSEPTEPYRIASHFDPVGTSQNVVNVEMPDIKALAAKPFGLMSIRMKWPSKLNVSSPIPGVPVLSIGGALTCCKSIPLVTIIATILLEIFTPIFVAILQLYYLLYANFCFGSLPAPTGGVPLLNALAPPQMPPGTQKPGDALIAAGLLPADVEKIAVKIKATETVSRTRSLVWEPEENVRPRVDDPRLLVLTQ